MKQIEGFGFKNIHAYMRGVFEKVAFIGLQPDGRIVLVAEFGGAYHHVVCQWDSDVDAWSVTTAIPKRNMRDVVVMWRSETA